MSDLTTNDVEVPVPAQGERYTDEQLREAFDLVKNRNNWKMPIRRQIPADKADIVGEAIAYFCGCHAEFYPVQGKPDRLLAVAAGYYACIGA